MDPFRCGTGPCGFGHGAANRGWNWLGLVDSIALWLLLIAAVFLVVALIRRAGGGRAVFTRRVPVGTAPTGLGSAGIGPTGWAPAVPPHIAQAEATLADRFARGEIPAQQYQEQLAVLRGYQPQQAAASGGTSAAPPAAPPSAAPDSAEQPPPGPGPTANP